MKLAASTCLLVFGLGVNSAGAEVAWKLTSFGTKCQDIESGNVEQGQDFIFRRCSDLSTTSTWILYQEGTRMSVGFGSQPHTALAGLNTERDSNWPVQWVGDQAGAPFVPRVAIVRFKRLEQTQSTLFVFRLLDNGSSCVVSKVEAGASQNSKAKALAEKAMTSWTCLSEPVPVTS